MYKLAVAVSVVAVLAVSVLSFLPDGGEAPSEADTPVTDGRLSMTSIIIPEYSVSIGERAFEGCRSLEYVTLHSGVSSIGAGAFFGCPSLIALTFAGSGDLSLKGESPIIEPSEGLAVINSLDGGRLTIPSGMIGGNGISRAQPGSAYIYSGSVWKEAYQLTFEGDSVSKVAGTGEYRGRVVMPPTASAISDDYNGQIFTGFDKTWVTSVAIPEGVKSIGAGAFSGCDRLQSVELPRTLVSIGRNAFYGCSSLESPDLPPGLKDIGRNAFYGCSSMVSMSVPDGVSDISGAFYGCSSLRTVSLPRGLSEIGESTFYGCSSLESVEISDVVVSIASSAFYRCVSLSDVRIPGSVSAVGSRAFEGCTGLSSLTMEEGMSSIEYRAFAGCSSLTSVSIPASVSSIGADAFSGCFSMTEIEFGAAPVLDVGSDAFPVRALLSEAFYYENGSKMISNYSVFGKFEYRYGQNQGYHRTAS